MRDVIPLILRMSDTIHCSECLVQVLRALVSIDEGSILRMAVSVTHSVTPFLDRPVGVRSRLFAFHLPLRRRRRRRHRRRQRQICSPVYPLQGGTARWWSGSPRSRHIARLSLAAAGVLSLGRPVGGRQVSIPLTPSLSFLCQCLPGAASAGPADFEADAPRLRSESESGNERHLWDRDANECFFRCHKGV